MAYGKAKRSDAEDGASENNFNNEVGIPKPIRIGFWGVPAIISIV